MMRPTFAARIALIGTLMVSVAAPAADVSVHIAIPPPPQIVFESAPEVVIVPQTRVEYVPVVTGYDMYRYGKYWYVNQDGYWYRSRSYRGPFKYVDYRQVPQAVVVVPADYRHHPVRPKHIKHKQSYKHRHKHKHIDDD